MAVTFVSCRELPGLSAIYDMTSPPEAHRPTRRFVCASAQDGPQYLYPFTLAEIQRDASGLQPVDQCITWPVPSPAYPPVSRFRGRHVHRARCWCSTEIWTRSLPFSKVSRCRRNMTRQQVITHNTFHVRPSAMKTTARKIVRRFHRQPRPGDTSCAADIAEVRLVPSSQPQRRNSIRQRRARNQGTRRIPGSGGCSLCAR